MKISKKIISIFLVLVYVLTYIMPITTVFAESVNLYSTHHTEHFLQFSNGNKVRTAFVVYNDGVKEYPAYCLEPSKNGIGDAGIADYEVELKDIRSFPRFSESVTSDGIWRIVTHGYPYLTPSQMGVDTEDQAYFATKQAIYRYLAGQDVTYYDGGGIGEGGQKVYNAISTLLDYGYNHTEQMIQASASITQVKGLDFDNKDSNYYSATYSASSNTTFQFYEVSLNTDKTGVIVTDENNNLKSRFNANEKFKVLVPKNIVTNDFSVEINAFLNCETKAALYGESSNSALQSYLVTTDPYENVRTFTTLSVDKLQEDGEISVYKIDSETKEPISNVTFELYKDNVKIGTATTNSTGKARFSNLDEGNYVIKEVSTNSEYILNETTKSISIGFNEKKEVTIENKHKKGNLKIIKLDKDNKKTGIEGVVFSLYSKETGETFGPYTTNAEGIVLAENLRTGEYTIKEVSTNKWYKKGTDVNVTIAYDTTKNIEIFNELRKGKIKVIKVDDEDNEIKLQNVVFNVMNEKGEILETITTDVNGEAITKEYPIRYEYIYLQEKSTDAKYQLNTEVYKVKLDEDKITSITIKNTARKGKIQITKMDLDDETLGVEGAVFEIINDKTGQVVDTITTNEKGIAVSKDLSIIYTYTVREVATNKKYKPNSNPIVAVELTLEGEETQNIPVTNEKRKGQVRIIKVDKDDNEVLLEGVVFEIFDTNHELVDTITTDERGEAISRLLPCVDEIYTIREKSTLIEYVLNEEPQTIVLEENQIKDITFENEKIKGRLKIIKIDSKDNTKKLDGAIFGIYNSENELIEIIVTDSNGVAISPLLVYGDYGFREIYSGSKYYFIISDEVYEFQIRENGEIIEKTIENEPVDIEVNVDKTGSLEVQPDNIVNYQFENIQNKSNIYLDSFKWYDYIPTEAVRLTEITTGTWNQELKYSVYYKTNLLDEYILYKDNLDTNENYTLDFTEIEFEQDEYITEICFDFGKVDVEFGEMEKPTMKCVALDTLEDGAIFTNITKVIGSYGRLIAEATSEWKTIIHKLTEPEPKLPKTGK